MEVFEFSRAEEKDAEGIVQIVNWTNREFYDYLRKTHTATLPFKTVDVEKMKLEIRNNIYYKIILNNRIVGSIFIKENEDGTSFYSKVFIHKDYNDIGIGTQSIGFLINNHNLNGDWNYDWSAREFKNYYYSEKTGLVLYGRKLSKGA